MTFRIPRNPSPVIPEANPLEQIWAKNRTEFLALRARHLPGQNLESLMRLILSSPSPADYPQSYIGLIFDARAKTTRDAFGLGYTVTPKFSMLGEPEAFHLFLAVGGRVFDFDFAGKSAEPVPDYLKRLFGGEDPAHVEIARLPVAEFLAQAKADVDLLVLARGDSMNRLPYVTLQEGERKEHPGLSRYVSPEEKRAVVKIEAARAKNPLSRFWLWLQKKVSAVIPNRKAPPVNRVTSVLVPGDAGPKNSWEALNLSFDRRPTSTRTDSLVYPDLRNAVEPMASEKLSELRSVATSARAGRILADALFAPVTLIRFEGREVYLSGLLQDDENRKYVLALIRTKTRVEAFLYYASQSGGSWRYTTGVIFGTFFKGFGASYTQETQPIEAVLRYLQDREEGPAAPVDKSLIEGLFNIQDASSATQVFAIGHPEKVRYFQHEGLKGVQKFRPGTMFVEDVPSLATLNQVVTTLPAGFIPDFSKSLSDISPFFHQMLGACLVFHHEAMLDDRKVFWDISVREEDGLGWVNHIHFADGRGNRFGGQREIIDTGFVTSKPVEYREQLSGIVWNTDSEYYPLLRPTSISHYMDIREILAKLSFMQDFYKSPDFKNWEKKKETVVPVAAEKMIARSILPAHTLHSAAVFATRVRQTLPVFTLSRFHLPHHPSYSR